MGEGYVPTEQDYIDAQNHYNSSISGNENSNENNSSESSSSSSSSESNNESNQSSSSSSSEETNSSSSESSDFSPENSSSSNLPNGEQFSDTPTNIIRYLNVDGLRDLLRHERNHWNLKVNKNMDFYDKQHNWKYTGDVHNEAMYQRVEIRTYPDNGALEGYAGLNNDSGQFGIVHNLDKWDNAISTESLNTIVNRTQIGASAKILSKNGFGLDNSGQMSNSTSNRQASILFDPFDGRAYLYSNDDPSYINNESRKNKLPLRTVARIGDIPTNITDLINDQNFISDPDYHHTDNNFTNSNRFVVDNLDDRTFVYPEISKDSEGRYIENKRVGLNGDFTYGESDSINVENSFSDLQNDRHGDAVNSIGANKNYSGVYHQSGFLPGIFRSLEELEKVDLVGQKRQKMTHNDSPGTKRPFNYYLIDGVWKSEWFTPNNINESFKGEALNPNNLETESIDTQPTPYMELNQVSNFKTSDLYQWRYNRLTLKYYSSNTQIFIINGGSNYEIGDVLRWTFGENSFFFKVTAIDSEGAITEGFYDTRDSEIVFDESPSTNGVGVSFTNLSSSGKGAKLAISSRPVIENYASQIKNNLYAYVDVVPSVRSENDTMWSDTSVPSTYDGLVTVRSTAPGPAYSGVNAGRGGPLTQNVTRFYEHGGNPTAGVHLHLFHYVINTQNPTFVIKDGVKVYTGKWVDMGPLGVERPCDIKALLLSNPDTNCFNNYYKFSVDTLIDGLSNSPDSIITGNDNSTSQAFFHVSNHDPNENTRFTQKRINPDANQFEDVDITNKVLYINGATGVMFIYNTSYKNDNTYGYANRGVGWIPIAGAISR